MPPAQALQRLVEHADVLSRIDGSEDINSKQFLLLEAGESLMKYFAQFRWETEDDEDGGDDEWSIGPDELELDNLVGGNPVRSDGEPSIDIFNEPEFDYVIGYSNGSFRPMDRDMKPGYDNEPENFLP